MGDDGGRRPKRRCASRAGGAMPSATHYVGYVEDDETPEMIMAKFLELERIQKTIQEAKTTADAAADGATEGQPAADAADGAAAEGATADAIAAGINQDLTDEQLLEVFKQTSMFNVKTAMQDNAMLLGIDEVLDYTAERYGYEDEVSDDDDLLKSFWSDDEGDAWGEDGSDEEGGRRRRRRGSGGKRAGGGGGTRLQRNAGGVRARHSIVTAYNPDTQALVRRRVRVADPDEVVQIRVPAAPIPLSWGRTVRPYAPSELRGEKAEAVAPAAPRTEPPASGYVELPSLARLDPKTLPVGQFQAALINPGWDRGVEGAAGLEALSRLPMPRLVPTGFIFIWTPKHHVQGVCKLMSKWGYAYIENLTWVYLGADHSVMKLPSRFVRNSHLTLYMFRAADKGRDIELRHQRNPDVTFECLKAAPGAGRCGAAAAPEETFVAVETLLPTGKGKLLELWAPQGVRRPGWCHVVEAGAAEA